MFGENEVKKRQFVKKWNILIEDFCYKEVGINDLNIMDAMEFSLLQISDPDNIIVINEGALPE
jgi:hypothetical protein